MEEVLRNVSIEDLICSIHIFGFWAGSLFTFVVLFIIDKIFDVIDNRLKARKELKYENLKKAGESDDN